MEMEAESIQELPEGAEEFVFNPDEVDRMISATSSTPAEDLEVDTSPVETIDDADEEATTVDSSSDRGSGRRNQQQWIFHPSKRWTTKIFHLISMPKMRKKLQR